MPTRRFHCVYELAAPDLASARRLAGHLALEQSVEMPRELVPETVHERWAGHVEGVTAAGKAAHRGGRSVRRWRAVVSFPCDLVNGSAAQLWNVVFGNVSMYPAARLVDVDLAPLGSRSKAHGFAGPAFGIAGWRQLTGAVRRPLLLAVLKPVGSSPGALARLAHELAWGGFDVIKDDHTMGDQRVAPFAERARRCADAVRRANARSGGSALYAPHLAGRCDPLEQAEMALEAGCGALLVCPFLIGFESLTRLASWGRLPLLSHPTLSGGLLPRSASAARGIDRALLWGDLLRWGGADGVIHTRPGGRFGGSWPETLRLVERLRRAAGPIAPSLPVVGGSVERRFIETSRERYGDDVMFLVGSDLRRAADTRAAAQRLRALVEGVVQRA